MHIELSEQEYRNLLDVLHIADVVMSRHRREPDPRSELHRALLQKLYALAEGAGQARLIQRNGVGTFVPTADFEGQTLAHLLIDEFSDHLFWDELISRLAVRDAAREAGGMDRLNAMNDDERQAAEGPLRQRYIDEFSANGIANLALVERFATGPHTQVKTSD
jgi:hypothetical protein